MAGPGINLIGQEEIDEVLEVLLASSVKPASGS
jgi:hypothetical protein